MTEELHCIALLELALGLLLGSIGLPGGAGASEEARTGRQATVIIDRQVVLFTENGREANLAIVSTGMQGHATPTGEFSVRYRLRAPMSSIYMVRMPYWICIDSSGALGFHQAPGNRALSMLGRPVSHGCIRLGRETAQWAYDWLTSGSRVLILPRAQTSSGLSLSRPVTTSLSFWA
ncbi:L,D-transpeptidase [Candidatus Fermentibacteria bacterium]|nr:L,D-transpeptidase [Candidatus Fermentibacteria bacterium]